MTWVIHGCLAIAIIWFLGMGDVKDPQNDYRKSNAFRDIPNVQPKNVSKDGGIWWDGVPSAFVGEVLVRRAAQCYGVQRLSIVIHQRR